MSEPGIAFYVVGALVTVYIVAATWRSRDAGYRLDSQASRLRGPPVDRRLVHWWRARRRLRSHRS